ncbi:MAG: PQQ-binding-like beta-propeller repeat protein [Candidatus Poribacteria bacterium]|nr:PQQ-binding-like beta-propeller repeat protein [Candidatus Poribacteria bacterium]
MKKLASLTICICASAVFAIFTLNTIADHHGTKTEQTSNFEKNWHYWRGPHSTGMAVTANPPTTWSETENIRWKVPIPGLGHATPIIWEDLIFIQTAIKGEMPETESAEDENTSEESQSERRRNRRNRNRNIAPYKFNLLALKRSDGSVLWEKTLRETAPHEGMHGHSSFASNSPTTDGKHIYAYFGSRGLYCLDFKGNLIWEKDIGQMRKAGTFGEGSCPVIYGDAIIVLQDHQGQSFITALDKHTGDELWRMDRDEPTTWASPIVVDYNDISQVIVPATNRTRSYDLANGALVWECGGMTRNVIPSPMHKDGHIYVISGHGGSSLQSINLELASGDITGTEAVNWHYDRDTPYVPSPLLSGNIIYFLKRNGNLLTAIDRNSGEVLYGPERVKGVSNVYASIVGAAGRVYIAGRDGNVAVLKDGPALEVIALNNLNDSFNASPAIVGSELYLRGTKYLYCIAE